MLLGMQRKHAEWRRHLSPYWRSLPTEPGSILCRHVFTEEEADMLQSDDLVRPCSSCHKVILRLLSDF